MSSPESSEQDQKKPSIESIAITLHITTGNLIHGEFDNAEDALAFAQFYNDNPQAILDRITPKKRPKDDQT